MDDNEREYFRRQLAALDSARRRWQLATFFLLATLVLFLLLSAGTLLTFGLFQTQRLREEAMMEREQARAAEQQARMQAEVAEASLREVEKANKALQEADRTREKTASGKKAGDNAKPSKGANAGVDGRKF